MFKQLEKITAKPKPFQFYTTPYLWNDEYISQQMLNMHLNKDIEPASRNHSFITNSIEWICNKFNVNSDTSICDFGCGPGLYTNQFAKRGARVTGIDLSKRSIDYAAKQAKEDHLHVEYCNQNYLEFIPKQKYDLITMIYCDFCVLSPKQIKTLLSIFNDALKPSGHLLLDVFSKNWFKKQNEGLSIEVSEKEGFWSNEKYYAIKNTVKYKEESIYLDKYTLIQDNAEKEIYNWLKCYEKDELYNLFSENGFNIETFYMDVSGSKFDENSDTIAISACLKA